MRKLIDQVVFLGFLFGLTVLTVVPFLLISACGDNSPPSSSYTGRLDPTTGWTSYGTGAGFIARLPDPFMIPTQSSGKTINYVYTQPLGLAIGKTMTLTYSVIGDGAVAPFPESNCGASGCGPARITLFIWGKGADVTQDRWWCGTAVLTAGDNQTLSCVVSPEKWTGVYAQPGNANFNASVANPFSVGFTFGGMFFGHGVWTTSGSATFKVNSFTVQ